MRQIPELNPKAAQSQGTLFDECRFHAFFTTVDPEAMDSVAADAILRQHSVIEQGKAVIKDSSLADLPPENFAANSAWLAAEVMVSNLTRATGILAGGAFTKARTATVRRKLICVPARTARSARKIRIRLLVDWSWQPE